MSNSVVNGDITDELLNLPKRSKKRLSRKESKVLTKALAEHGIVRTGPKPKLEAVEVEEPTTCGCNICKLYPSNLCRLPKLDWIGEDCSYYQELLNRTWLN